MKKLHDIQPSLTGCFLDYLMRRLICEIIPLIHFQDTGADHQCNIVSSCDCNGIITETNIKYSYFPVTMSESYKKTRNTKLYKTEDILSEIFITSLSHTLCYKGILNEEKILTIVNLIKTTEKINEIFIEPLKNVCLHLLENSINVLLNPALGGLIPELNDGISSDCDLVIDNNLYDFKCTIGDHSTYEILQLMGYSALINCNPKFNTKIDNIYIINILQGTIIQYNISSITNKQMIKYLQILTQ